nr:MAG TPA: hypothetical protein [Caudoviricetes sp.]
MFVKWNIIFISYGYEMNHIRIALALFIIVGHLFLLFYH